MRTDGPAETYARALLDLASVTGAYTEAEDGLKAVVTAVRGHADLRDALKNAALPAERKREIMRELFAEVVSPPALSIATVAVENGHADQLDAIAAAYTRLVETELGIVRAEVRTAIPLTDSLREQLTGKLTTAVGKRVVLAETVDPAILGGIVIHVAGRVLDGSLLRQLADMRTALVRAPVGGEA
jgi:F-type H+-transporting ATPase subunit delta